MIQRYDQGHILQKQVLAINEDAKGTVLKVMCLLISTDFKQSQEAFKTNTILFFQSQKKCLEPWLCAHTRERVRVCIHEHPPPLCVCLSHNMKELQPLTRGMVFYIRAINHCKR